MGYEPVDIEVFLDADMAILAAKPARYRRYLRGVRSEYSHFDDEAFRTGRMTFLRSILERERVFCGLSPPKKYRRECMRTLGGILCIYRVHKRRPPRAG